MWGLFWLLQRIDECDNRGVERKRKITQTLQAITDCETIPLN